MKHSFLQKAKPVTSFNSALPDYIDSSIKPVNEESSRNRTSVAMLGLALSMGTTGVLLPHQHGRALAADHIAAHESLINLTTSTPEGEGNDYVSKVDPSQPKLAALNIAPPQFKHKVKKGESIWKLSQNYEVAPEAIATSNQLQPSSTIFAGQTLNIPVVANNNGNEKQELKSSSARELIGGNSVSVADKVDNLLQKQQENNLKELEKEENFSNKPNKNSLAVERNMNESPRITALQPGFNQPVEIPVPSLGQETMPDTPSQQASNFSAPIEIPVPLPEKVTNYRTNSPQSSNQNLPTTVVINKPQDITPATPVQLSQPRAIPTTPLPLSVPQPQLSQPRALPPIPAQPSSQQQVYQVQRGDTLNSIARNHGISRTELIRANNITNPNLIKVNQSLVIPKNELSNNNYQTPTLISAIPTAREVGTNTLSSSLPINNVTTNEVSTTDNAEVDPYVAKLRANIVRLRQEYQSQLKQNQSISLETSQQDTNSLDNPINELRSLEEKSSSNPSVSIPVIPPTVDNSNTTVYGSLLPPEKPETTNRTNPFANRIQQPQLISQQIRSNTPTVINVPQPRVLGAAPTQAPNYNPMLRSPVGETVSPELPPLLSPDQYLPDNRNFNGYIWPAKGVLTSGYGWRWGRMHRGIDIAAPIGTPIMAAAGGDVVYAGWNSGGYGNLVKVKHYNGSVTLYAHNSRLLVRKGQKVQQGQQIAEMGSTGYSTGPHLHFEIYPDGNSAANPMAFLPKRR